MSTEAAEDFAALAPLIEEMAARGYLDAWLVRHPEHSSHVETAAQRLIAKIGFMLGDGMRGVIRSQELEPTIRPAVAEVVGSCLVETVHKIIDPDPVASFMDQVNGKHRLIAPATRNRVVSETRKTRVRTRMLVAVEELPEAVAEEEVPEPPANCPEIPPEWLAAAERLEARGVKVNQKNLARELRITPRHLRRLMSAFRESRVK